jgi:hypothetical protein
MNSVHQSAHEQPSQFAPWLERAKCCFVGATIHGSGRYAVAVMNHVDVFLYETMEESADHLSQDPKFRFYDLLTFAPPVHKMNPCRTIPDAYDPDEGRRERRERRAAAHQGIA